MAIWAIGKVAAQKDGEAEKVDPGEQGDHHYAEDDEDGGEADPSPPLANHELARIARRPRLRHAPSTPRK